MGDKTGIAWTEHTWNPWQGCHKVSPGCKHCYMFSEKHRYGKDPDIVVRSKPPTFNSPLKWKDPALVFTCSWSDFFVEEADPWREEAWDIIARTPHLTYQILTKRPERISSCLPRSFVWGAGLPNVWLGFSAENGVLFLERVNHLVHVPAAVHFVSYEPALGPIDVARGFAYHELRGDGVYHRVPGLDWVIVGGESGYTGRIFDLKWARDVIDQCRTFGVKVFIKQLGSAYRYVDDQGRPVIVQPRDRKGGDPSEWPEDLRVRQFPTEEKHA